MAFERLKHAIDLRKLGTCMYCIGLATRLTLVSLSGYFITSTLFISEPLAALFLIAASAFILLLIAHGIAYLRIRRKAAQGSAPE